VQPIDGGSKYEILSGHNRVEGAKVVGLNTIPAIVKENLSEEEAEMYVIETNLIQRGFNELSISEQATVLQSHNSKMFSQGKRNDILEELELLEYGATYSHRGNKLKGRATTMDKLGLEYSMSKSSVARILRINYLITPLKELVDRGSLILVSGVELSYVSEDNQKKLYTFLQEHPNHKKINFRLAREFRNFCSEKDSVLDDESLERMFIKETKPIEYKKFQMQKEIYTKYFDEKTSDEEVIQTIQKALEMYFSK
jgi:ParB family chromosome partitioning protein